MTTSLNFFKQYHSTVIKALGEDAKNVKVNCDEKDYILDIKGCAICHGNEILRKEGLATACPIVQAAKYAAVKKLGRNVITKGVDKPGTVGECIIRFELE